MSSLLPSPARVMQHLQQANPNLRTLNLLERLPETSSGLGFDRPSFGPVRVKRTANANTAYVNEKLYGAIDSTISFHDPQTRSRLQKEFISQYGYVVDPSGDKEMKWDLYYTSNSKRAAFGKDGVNIKGLGVTHGQAYSTYNTDGCATTRGTATEIIMYNRIRDKGILPFDKLVHPLGAIALSIAPNSKTHKLLTWLFVRAGDMERVAHHMTNDMPLTFDDEKMRRTEEATYKKPMSLQERMSEMADSFVRLEEGKVVHGAAHRQNIGSFGAIFDLATASEVKYTPTVHTLPSSNVFGSGGGGRDEETSKSCFFNYENKSGKLAFLDRDRKEYDAIRKDKRNCHIIVALTKVGNQKDLEFSASIMKEFPKKSEELGKAITRLKRFFYKGFSHDAVNHPKEAYDNCCFDVEALQLRLIDIFFDEKGKRKPTTEMDLLALFKPETKGHVLVPEALELLQSNNRDVDSADVLFAKYSCETPRDAYEKAKQYILDIYNAYPLIMEYALTQGIQEGKWSTREEAISQIRSQIKARLEKRETEQFAQYHAIAEETTKIDNQYSATKDLEKATSSFASLVENYRIES